MNWIWIIVLYSAYHVVNIIIARINADTVQRRIDNRDAKQIEHGWWFLLYVVLCVPMGWAVNWWFVGAVLCLHGSVFPVAYNSFRHLAPFNLSKTSKAVYDRTLVKMGFKDMEIPDFAAEFVSALLFTVSLFAA